jgi:hypothetical protein
MDKELSNDTSNEISNTEKIKKEEEKDEIVMEIPEECIELKNIKYKSMILNGIPWPETKASNDLSNLEQFLENEKNNNKNEPWSKLDKTIKTQKLLLFADKYKEDKQLDDSEYSHLTRFLKDCLDRKKLQRVKDVIYDKATGLIKDIPGLFHNKGNKHFTIKNLDKRVSTVKSLAPKKIKGTIKNTAKENVDL